VTRKLDIPLLCNPLISSGRRGYNVGSPVSDSAKCFGFSISFIFVGSALSYPLKPWSLSTCALMHLSIIVSESSITSPNGVSFRSRQQYTQSIVHMLIAGLICTHWCVLIP